MSTVSHEDVTGVTDSHRVVDPEFHFQFAVNQFVPKLFNYVEDDQARERFQDFGPPFPANSGWNYDYANTVEDKYGEMVGMEKADVVEAKEELGLDVVILSPADSVPMSNAPYADLKNHLAQAYHDFMLEEIVDVDEGIYANAITCHWDPEWGANELQRVGSKEGIVGAGGWITLQKPFGDTDFDVLFEQLVDHDLPLVLHGKQSTRYHDLIDGNLQTMVENKVVGEGRTMLGSVMNMVQSGVFDVYPELRVVIQNLGATWIPYAADRGDEIAQMYSGDYQLTERMYGSEEFEYLPGKPSEYIRDHCYVTTQPSALSDSDDEEFESLLTASRASDTFMFSTNYPETPLNSWDWITRPEIDDEMRARILHKNAEEAFAL